MISMATTNIEWTDKVWNPLTGCTKIGQGCKHCYAEVMARRLQAMGLKAYQGVVNERGWTGKVNLLPEKIDEPLRWKKPARIFVNSMSDLFHESVPSDFIRRVVETMMAAHWHTFQVLTKRYKRPMFELNQQDASKHIFIGFSICNQRDADMALEPLRAVSQLGWRTWISNEPCLEPIKWDGYEFIDWMVTGGESGRDARPMHPDWARRAEKFCRVNGIPFLFKQWGEWMPVAELYSDDGSDLAFEYMNHWVAQMEPNGAIPVMSKFDEEGYCQYQPCPGSWFMAKVGKKAAGRMLDGMIYDAFPEVP